MGVLQSRTVELAATEDPTEPRPWRTMWLAPRQTIRNILDAENPPSWVLVLTLACLLFVIVSLEGDASGRVAVASSMRAIAWTLFDVGFHIIAAPIFMAWLARWLGKIASTSAIREAVVWSYVPLSASVVLWVPALLIVGPLAAAPTTPHHLVLDLTWVGVLIALIWSFVLGVIAVAEVLRIGAWKALAMTLVASIPGFALYGVR